MGTGATDQDLRSVRPPSREHTCLFHKNLHAFRDFLRIRIEFTLESLVPSIRISRSSGSWLFSSACSTGSRFTESMSGSSYTQVLPLWPSSMTRYSAPNAFCNRQVQRSSSLYLLRGRHSPTDRCRARGYWNLRCTKYVFHCLTLRFLFQSVTIQDQYVKLQY